MLPSAKDPIDDQADTTFENNIPAGSPIMCETPTMPPQLRGNIRLPRSNNLESLKFTAPEKKRHDPSLPQGQGVETSTTGPVRIKKSLLDAVPLQHTEPERPPATPASFCTRLEAENISLGGMQNTPEEARVPVTQDTTYASGNTIITLVAENSTFKRRNPFSPSRRSRQQRSASSDLTPVEDSPSPKRQPKGLVDNHTAPAAGIRKSQHGLMDSMSQITKDVMYRFGEEEDAIRAKVKQFRVGGTAVVGTLREAWNDRLLHHYGKLRKDLEEEKAALDKASETLNAAKAGQLEVLRNGDAMVQKIDEKTDV